MTDIQFLARPDGARLAYCATPAATAGAGRPGVLFCGGFKSDMSGSKALALEAAARARGTACVRFDYFGHGQSDGAFLDGSIGRWKEDTLAILREVCDGPQIIVGSSMGGWLATLAALALPDKAAGLVLVAPALDFTEDLMWAQMDEQQRKILLRDGILREPSQYSDQPYEYTLKLITEGREHMILKPGISFDRPVRILQGMEDPDVPYQHAVKTAAAFQGGDTRLTLLRDGDHRLSRPQDLDLLIDTVWGLL